MICRAKIELSLQLNLESMEKRKIKPEQALMRLESLCARSEQSTWELQQKLIKWGLAQGDISKIMNELIKGRFVDDNRFAQAYCRDKFRFSRWGRIKIRHALLLKRISKDFIDAALEEIDEQEYESTLLEILISKSRLIDDVRSYDGKTRLFRYAVSRGYEPAIVAKMINSGKVWSQE